MSFLYHGYLRLGFTEEEVIAIIELEEKETSELRGFQYWASRYDLIKSGITTVEKVRGELNNEC